MRDLTLSFVVALPLFLLGCGDDGMDPPTPMPDGDPPMMDASPDADPPMMDASPDADPPMMDASTPDADPPMMDAPIPDADPPTGVSWSRDVLPMLRSSCGGCHTRNSQGGWSIGGAGASADRAYATLVDGSGGGVMASTRGCDQLRVVPGNADASFVYNKVAESRPFCGGSMPPGRMLSAANQRMLRDWINEGAMNN